MAHDSRSEHPGITATAYTAHGEIEYFIHDDPIGYSVKNYGGWASAEIRLLDTFIGEGDIVVDVGANIGTHTLAFARRVGQNGKVFAYEPQKKVSEILERNLTSNGILNAEVIEAALGREPGEVAFDEPSYGGHTNIGAVCMRAPTTQTHSNLVRMETIDGRELAACRLLKIDAEGMGAAVIAGAVRTIERARPVVFVECDTVAEAAAILHAMPYDGYELFVVRTAAFDDQNDRRNLHNIFGVAQETALLFLPEPGAMAIPIDLYGVILIRCRTLDDVAEALGTTPRYGDRTNYDRDAAALRNALEDIEAQHRNDTARLSFRIASLEWQLNQVQSIDTPSIAVLEERIRAMEASTSWRITAPVRALKLLLNGRRR
jgi:FkbM family methyltransferase